MGIEPGSSRLDWVNYHCELVNLTSRDVGLQYFHGYPEPRQIRRTKNLAQIIVTQLII